MESTAYLNLARTEAFRRSIEKLALAHTGLKRTAHLRHPPFRMSNLPKKWSSKTSLQKG